MMKKMKETLICRKDSERLGDFDESGPYGENNGPIDDWIKRNQDDPHDEMRLMSNPGDRDYEC